MKSKGVHGHSGCESRLIHDEGKLVDEDTCMHDTVKTGVHRKHKMNKPSVPRASGAEGGGGHGRGRGRGCGCGRGHGHGHGCDCRREHEHNSVRKRSAMAMPWSEKRRKGEIRSVNSRERSGLENRELQTDKCCEQRRRKRRVTDVPKSRPALQNSPKGKPAREGRPKPPKNKEAIHCRQPQVYPRQVYRSREQITSEAEEINPTTTHRSRHRSGPTLPTSKSLLHAGTAENLAGEKRIDKIFVAGVQNGQRRKLKGESKDSNKTTSLPLPSQPRAQMNTKINSPSETFVTIFGWSNQGGKWISLTRRQQNRPGKNQRGSRVPIKCFIDIQGSKVRVLELDSWDDKPTTNDELPQPSNLASENSFVSPSKLSAATRPDSAEQSKNELFSVQLSPQVSIQKSTALDIILRFPGHELDSRIRKFRNFLMRAQTSSESEKLFHRLTRARYHSIMMMNMMRMVMSIRENDKTTGCATKTSSTDGTSDKRSLRQSYMIKDPEGEGGNQSRDGIGDRPSHKTKLCGRSTINEKTGTGTGVDVDANIAQNACIMTAAACSLKPRPGRHLKNWSALTNFRSICDIQSVSGKSKLSSIYSTFIRNLSYDNFNHFQHSRIEHWIEHNQRQALTVKVNEREIRCGSSALGLTVSSKALDVPSSSPPPHRHIQIVPLLRSFMTFQVLSRGKASNKKSRFSDQRSKLGSVGLKRTRTVPWKCVERLCFWNPTTNGVSGNIISEDGPAIGIRCAKVRFFWRNQAPVKWMDLGYGLMSVYKCEGLAEMKRVRIIKSTRCTVLFDAILHHCSFERVARKSIAINLPTCHGEIRENGAISQSKYHVFLVQMTSERECAFTFSLIRSTYQCTSSAQESTMILPVSMERRTSSSLSASSTISQTSSLSVMSSMSTSPLKV